MRIISLNVNNFGGKHAKPLLKNFELSKRKYDWAAWGDAVDEWRNKYRDIILLNVSRIVDIVSDYDVVFLHEVDTNCESWDVLKNKMHNGFAFEMPNGIKEYTTGRSSISCAFIKKGIKYKCSCHNSFNGYSRNVELQFEDTIIVGLHMNYGIDMWTSLEKIAKELAGKNALIIGDLNVCDEGTERIVVLNSLVDSGDWEDIWTYQGDAGDTPTCDTGRRIDYVLATKSLAVHGVCEIIINAIRKQDISDHAAIIALL